jgi:hypothetical protein
MLTLINSTMGLQLEIRKDPSMPLEKAIEIVVKQLGKDPMYYIRKCCVWCRRHWLHRRSIPGLTPKDIKGKYISSGYGDLNESKMKN